MTVKTERIAIIGAGVGAARLLKAARELETESGRRFRIISVLSARRRGSWMDRESDEAFFLPADKPPFDLDGLIDSLRAAEVEAVAVSSLAMGPWVALAEECEARGWTFVGPSVTTLRRLMDPVDLRRRAEEVGVQTVPWSGGPVESVELARAHADRLGYPVLCRHSNSSRVGFGVAATAAELPAVYRRVARSARDAGSTVLLERFMHGTRRLEVPIVSVPGGPSWALDVIDASLRRRDGSIMIEAPASGLDAGESKHIREVALELSRVLEHEHVGTMVFLRGASSTALTFLGYDFCCGGEHSAVEALRGFDLTKAQLRLALGESMTGVPAEPRGVASVAHVKVRPRGREAMVLEHIAPATGTGVRTFVGAAAGDGLDPSVAIAELATWGQDRHESLTRMSRALSEASLVVRGGEASSAVLRRALSENRLWEGPVDTDWLAQHLRAGDFAPRKLASVALVDAAIEAYELEHDAARQEFHAAARRGRARAEPAGGRTIELIHDGQVYVLRVQAIDRGCYRLTVDGHTIAAVVEHRRGNEHRLELGGNKHRIVSVRTGYTHLVEVDGEVHHVLRDRSGMVRSPVPSVIAAIDVKEGDQVDVGDRIAVLESMKTEMSLQAPFAGRVRQVLVRPNVQVPEGASLVWIEPTEERVHSHSERVDFASAFSADGDSLSPVDAFSVLGRGYDVEMGQVQKALRGFDRSPPAFLDEMSVVETFAELLALDPPSPTLDDAEDGGLHLTPLQALRSYMTDVASQGAGLPKVFLHRLQRVLARQGVDSLEVDSDLLEALFRVHTAMARRSELNAAVLAILGRWSTQPTDIGGHEVPLRGLLDRLVSLTQVSLPGVCETVREARYRLFDGPLLTQLRQDEYKEVALAIRAMTDSGSRDSLQRLLDSPLPLSGRLLSDAHAGDLDQRPVILEALARRYHSVRDLRDARIQSIAGSDFFLAHYQAGDAVHSLVAWLGASTELRGLSRALDTVLTSATGPTTVDLYTWQGPDKPARLADLVDDWKPPSQVERVSVVLAPGGRGSDQPAPCVSFKRVTSGFEPDQLMYGMHPCVRERLRIDGLSNFELERVEAPQDVYAFKGKGRGQPDDQRIFVYAEVRDLTPVRDDVGRVVALPQVERMVAESLSCLRRVRAAQSPRERTETNRIELFVWPTITLERGDLMSVVRKLAPATVGLGIEQVRVNAELSRGGKAPERRVLRLSNPGGEGVEVEIRDVSSEPVPTMTRYEQKVFKLRARGLMYPYELIRLLTPSDPKDDLPAGEFQEYDFDERGQLVPVDREPGLNTSNIIVGLIRSWTAKHPEGLTRVALLGDPSRAMGSLAEPECRRIMAALDLAEKERIPAEWYAVSAGAEISKERGTENMDWIAAVLRRIIHYTQAGHELNIVVCGVNVGAQPYWNAEATMLMHTKGVLIMVPSVAMVLTGKQALDYSGGVSADDNLGIGGYEQIMGPNGQAQYAAPDLVSAGKLLLHYYEHTYRAPGERFPRARKTEDPNERDVCSEPYASEETPEFRTVGDIFSTKSNPGRKRPFDIRKVMGATVDKDSRPLERWKDMRDAETVVVWDAHLGGQPVCMLGIESRPIRRLGYVPADGPNMWTGGTLFPRSSKKAARAINAASHNRPLVILANLTGFDGSPESLRLWQLEFGAEIGRAVVNFDGPILFCVVSRFHGGAFVVFSNRLNDNMHSLALEGTYASVIGGAPAAAVVFARELRQRVENDARVRALNEELARATGTERAWLTVRSEQMKAVAHSERLGELADEYDGIHSVERARDVGSVHEIISPHSLRSHLIEKLQEAMTRHGGATA